MVPIKICSSLLETPSLPTLCPGVFPKSCQSSCRRPRTLWRALSGEWRKGHWQGAASGPEAQLTVWEMASPAAGFWWTIVRPKHTRRLAGGGGVFLEGVQVWAGEGRLGRPPPASKPWPACLFVRGGSSLGNALMQCSPKCQVQSKPPL